jgi:hypothetical protein
LKIFLFVPFLFLLIFTPAFGALSDKTGLVNLFDVETSGYTFEIKTVANFDVTNHEFDKDEKRLTIFINSGLENNLGEIIIPTRLLSGNFTFYLNDVSHNPIIKSNDKISFITLNFTGIGNNKIDIIATETFAAVPENSGTIDGLKNDVVVDGGGCLIATATYGSELSPQVQQLRELRDNQLLKTESGKLNIISQKTITLNENQAYVTDAEGDFSSNGESYNVKFREVMIYDTEKYYTFSYSNGIDNFDSQLSRFDETINSFEIFSKDPSTNESIEEGGGCLIATATFGSEMAPQVQQLRELRNSSLLSTQSGTAFMSTFNQFYYSFSPVIADLERENLLFKEAIKIAITPMISSLSLLNYVEMDSEESVLGYGISLIILNLAMYVGIPASVIIGIKQKF